MALQQLYVHNAVQPAVLDHLLIRVSLLAGPAILLFQVLLVRQHALQEIQELALSRAVIHAVIAGEVGCRRRLYGLKDPQALLLRGLLRSLH